MIKILAKLTKGHGLRGSLEYDFAPCKKTGLPRAQLIAGTLQGSPRQICRQAAPLRSLRKIANPIWRASLNADPADGIISAEKWTEICHDFLVGMGLNPSTTAWCAVRHTDHHDDPENPRDHVHLTVLRQQVDGSLFNIANDVFRSKKVTQMIEIKHRLVTHDREPAARRAPTVAQKCVEKKTGKMPSMEKIKNTVDQIFSEEKNDLTFEKLKEGLAKKRIGIRDPKTQKGRLQGFSYVDLDTGVSIPGSKLGTDYSLGMLARGLKYDQKDQLEEQNISSKTDKMPSMLKPLILPEQYSAKAIKPHAAHQTEVTLSTEKFNQNVLALSVGPAAKSMLLIASILISISVNLAKMIIAFLKRLMAVFGFGMRESALQKYEHPDQSAPALCYEPTQLAALAAPKSAEDKLAQKLYEVSKALEANDPNLLPVLDDPEAVKARAEVVKAMEDEGGAGGNGGGAATADAENFGFADEDFSSINAIAAASKIDPMDDLKAALAAHEVAARELKIAEIKNGPIHFSTVVQRQAELKIVREDLESARTKWQKYFTSNTFNWWVPGAEKAKFRLLVGNHEEAEKRAINAVAAAKAEDIRIDKIYAELPEAVVPTAIVQAEAEARLAVKTAREAIQAEAIESIQAIRSDVMMLPKMAEFELQFSSSLKNFHAIGQITPIGISVLESQMRELRRLKSAQEAARRAAMAEFDGDANKPDIDGQTVK